ncbi:MAG: endolytic transglycosylase MltG, partial [Acidimicrobiales bacterium]
MTRHWRTLGIVLTLVAFVLGFAGTFVTLNITQPVAADVATSVQFAVRPGDGASTVADRLATAGLIRNAAIFTMLAGLQHLDTHLQPGIYQLAPDMTMGAILHRLVGGHPDAVLIIVPPGKTLVQIPPGARVAQFSAYLAALPHVNAKAFMGILTTGILANGKHLSDQYWYVRPRQPGTVAALEGYIVPGNYFIDSQADESTAVQQLLLSLGEHLCPGPDAAHVDVYLLDHTQCKAHAVTVGSKGVSVFTEMDQRYHTSDDATGLYDALTLASLVVRISSADGDATGVAGVYYNRYLAAQGSGYAPNGEYIAYM